MTEIQSTNQAVHLLNDNTQDLRVPEAALHKLANEPAQVNLERLVSTEIVTTDEAIKLLYTLP